MKVKLEKPTRRSALPAPPAKPEPTGNLHKPNGAEKVPLQVKLAPEVRRAFRAHAAEQDMELSELFCAMWDHYRATAR
ncbi:hypothetical protein GGR16_000001 [Chelatococcus caeni]|uniref:Chromosome partitioning protein ParB n=1 Tax=Chelatococcus caeni TaxID=1348468 RepID=A0A840BNU9_9HYPH|nr:hypothetical protein [Chelatococcus caeni]